MKKLLLIVVLISTQVLASSASDDRDAEIGFCGGLHLVRGNHDKVIEISNMSRNKAVMQQAAKFYIQKFSTDPGKNIAIGEKACRNIGVK